jgi:hypothetical protein
VLTDSSVRECDPESSQSAGNDLDCRWSASTGLINDLEPRGLGLQLVVANFRKQNQGLGLHGALLSRPVPSLANRWLCRRSRRVRNDHAPVSRRWHRPPDRFFRASRELTGLRNLA